MSRWHWAIYVLCFFALRILVALLFSFALKGQMSAMGGFQKLESIYFDFVIVVLIAPLIETYLTQFLPFKFLESKVNPILIILISATIFGAFHWYSLVYMLYGFSAGLVYAFAFYFKRHEKPVLITAGIHAAFNLFVFLQHNL